MQNEQKNFGHPTIQANFRHKLTINVPLFKKLRDIFMSQSFFNSGTLVILCLFATMGPQLCPAVS
jgi:hypothetical protein